MMTTHDVIDRLGGNKAVAEMFGVGSSAVSNWRKDGRFPPRIHLQVYRKCQERGLDYDPTYAEQRQSAA